MNLMLRVSYDLVSPSICWINVISGVTWAAETISDNFEELIKDKLPVDYPNRAWVISRMRRIWDETHKYTFDGRSSHIPIVIGRPGAPEIQDAFS
jgi:hypothetical protein